MHNLDDKHPTRPGCELPGMIGPPNSFTAPDDVIRVDVNSVPLSFEAQPKLMSHRGRRVLYHYSGIYIKLGLLVFALVYPFDGTIIS